MAENLMIVDLVRNDLAKSSKPGSVKVEELFGIYSFKQLHQMISTVSSIKRENVDPVEVIKNAFPMGSMTGAPKIRAMELIEKYETTKRGVYSGASGYFTPEMDFDFNVLIRSIFYNDTANKLSFQVGSAITYDADPEYEYKECLLKAKAIFEILGLDFSK
jgi:para-aminobenzoate synthetase component 1